MNPTDDELVQRAQAGDQIAVDVLLNRHLAAMLLILQAKYGQAAEGLLQSALVRILQNLEQFKGGNFRAWCIRIAVNQSIDNNRRRRPKTTDAEIFQQQSAPEEDGPTQRLLRKEADEQLAKCLKRLDERERLVVQGKYGGIENDATLAAKLNLTVRTIYKLRTAALQKLRQCLGG